MDEIKVITYFTWSTKQKWYLLPYSNKLKLKYLFWKYEMLVNQNWGLIQYELN